MNQRTAPQMHELHHILVQTARFTSQHESRHTIRGSEHMIAMSPYDEARVKLARVQQGAIEQVLTDMRCTYNPEDSHTIRRISK